MWGTRSNGGGTLCRSWQPGLWYCNRSMLQVSSDSQHIIEIHSTGLYLHKLVWRDSIW